ncbi:hypothetical protein CEXT_203161 [Caerostris extrusa]|uniref:Uncharacterized protein n=1 Tax=Caerostris extrusa TaxID=172846 RepID=A0AAV4R271_CAEEX|nr:hypothetical protein CEXT_203161 [Caerostris extrusa]
MINLVPSNNPKQWDAGEAMLQINDVIPSSVELSQPSKQENLAPPTPFTTSEFLGFQETFSEKQMIVFHFLIKSFFAPTVTTEQEVVY